MSKSATVQNMVKKAGGFSLLELMIVLSVIAILLAWALPSYQDSVRKARRADAQSRLREFEVCAARRYTVDSSFANVNTGCKPPNDAYYTYTVTVGGSSLTYTITAAPKTGQSADKCGTMTVAHNGAATAAVSGCW